MMTKKKKTCLVPRWRTEKGGVVQYRYGSAYGFPSDVEVSPDGSYDRDRNVIVGASDLAEEVIETWAAPKKNGA